MTKTRTAASSIQRQFWLAEQMASGQGAYNVCNAFWIQGNLDPAKFHQSVQTLINRYDVLRARFEMSDGELYQVVEKSNSFEYIETVVDDSEDFEQQASALGDEWASTPFDLAKATPVRLGIVLNAHRDAAFVALIVHHIAIDLHTKDLLGNELSRLYNESKTPPLKKSETPPFEKGAGGISSSTEQSVCDEIPLTPFVKGGTGSASANGVAPSETSDYSEFCTWEKSFLGSDKATKMRRFWVDHLENRTMAIPMTYDFAPPAVASHRGRHHLFEIDKALKAKLTALQKETRLDPFVILLGAYIVLLQKYSRCGDFVVGVPLSNRQQEAFKNTIGCFVNTVPLAAEVDVNTDFITLLRNVRKQMLLGHRNQAVTVEQIVGAAKMGMDVSRNPIYQVGYTFEHPMSLMLNGLSVQPHICDTGGAQLELFLRFFNSGETMQGQLEFNTTLFSSEWAARFANYYQTLLEQLVENPSTPIQELGFLSDAARDVIVSFNQTDKDYELNTLRGAFEQQVDQTPNAVALIFNGETLSYGQLEQASNRLAHYLVAKGAAPGERVAVCMERSLDLFVAIYGIVKSGSAYVPIEPEYPPERSRVILDDVSPIAVISDNVGLAALPKKDARVLEWDVVQDEIASQSTHRVDAPSPICSPAYIIFTSGSTGRPKGVINCHEGIANRLCWMQEQFLLDSSDVVLFKTPFTFDVSVWELFWALQVGARVVIAPPGVHRDPAALCDLIDASGVTTLHFVPSMLDMFLSQDGQLSKGTVKRVICSGEALSIDLKNRFFERYPDIELHNLYGPTEAAVDVTHYQVGLKDENHIPIGKAIANTHMYIMDDAMNVLPVGVPGEICIGGVQVCKGYWNNDALTEKSFVEVDTPFGRERVYRTGDLGIYLDDGNIRFLGRIDFQVKIRGNRIETGEIESVLRKHENIQEAVVVAKVLSGAEPSLIAYVVAPSDIDIGQLKAHVGNYLPGYMVPTFIVPMKELPLNNSGKVDRKSLPKVDASTLLSKRPMKAASDETESIILSVWQKVLETDHISTTDNFMDVGGTSLLLMQVSNALSKKWKEKARVLALLQYPTIEALARYFNESDAQSSKGHVSDVKNASSRVDSRRAAMEKRRQQQKRARLKH